MGKFDPPPVSSTLIPPAQNLAGSGLNLNPAATTNTAAVSPDNNAQSELYTTVTQSFGTTTEVQRPNPYEAAEVSMANAALRDAYPTPIPVASGPTIPGTPSATATDPTLLTPSREDILQSQSGLFSFDNAMYSGAIDSMGESAKRDLYLKAKEALDPVGDKLAGNATGIVGLFNAVTNTLASTVNKAVGAIVDVFSGKLLTDAVSGLMTTAEKFVAMVGQAAYQNVMGFLEAFKSAETLLNSAANIASDIGQFVKKSAADIKSVLTQDWDKLSWPDVNWQRIKSCFDTESFTKVGTSIADFLSNKKLPIGLSVNEMKDLAKNLDVKEQLLNQVENVKNGVTKLGTEALNTLYGQLSAVNNAILGLAKLPQSLSNMFNSLVNRLDPLKERQANKAIIDYIKSGKVVKDGDQEEDIETLRAKLKSGQDYVRYQTARFDGYSGSQEDWDQLSDAEKFLRVTPTPTNYKDAKARIDGSLADLNDQLGVTNSKNFPSPQEINGYSYSDVQTYYNALSPAQQQDFLKYVKANQDAINAGGAQERRRAERTGN